MEVVAHPDPVALEAELLARVGALKRYDPLAPALILVPTRALVAHVQRRLAEALGAVLAVEVHHYRSLARRILEVAGTPAPRSLPAPLRDAIVEQLLDETAGEARTRFFHARPGARGRLGHALNELREAGVEPEELTEAAGNHPDDGWLARLYRAYVSRLRQLEELGWADEAAVSRRAAALAERYVGRAQPRLVLHHGAYELIGVHVELLRALDRAVGVRFLLPAAPGARATVYAERFAREFLLDGAAPRPLAPRAQGLLGERLGALYEPSARPEPLQRGVALRHVQGASPEVELALRHALAAVGEGTPAHEVAVVARAWEPYAAAGETALRKAAVPWYGSLETPLAREPLARDFLAALRAAADDFPRALTAEVLRSRRLRWATLGVELPPAARIERLSRSAEITGGLEGWTRALPAWAEAELEERGTEDPEQRTWLEERLGATRRIAAAVTALAARLDPGTPRTWSEHAARLQALLGEFFAPDTGEDQRAVEALSALLEAMAALEALEPAPVPFAKTVLWLDAAARETALPRTPEDRGGVRILDAMQLRGMTFRRVFVLGLHENGFVRHRREDPLLPDRLREALRARYRRPLPLRAHAQDEEHLLLALTLGAAREALDLSWQRADENGRARTPSLALREIARVIQGGAEPVDLAKKTSRLPTHPAERLRALAADPGRLTPLEARMLLAMEAADPGRAAAKLHGFDADLDRGLVLLQAIEAFGPSDLRFDGRAGTPELDGPLSVSAFEQLGRCPLQFFFRRVLRVRPLDEEAGMAELDAGALGSAVHAVLEKLYGELAGDTAPPDARRRKALRERLREVWRDETKALAAAWREALPLLWELTERIWLQTLDAFVEADLAVLHEAGERIGRVECPLEEDLELPEGVVVRLTGRLDREVHDRAGARVRICDYKTGKRRSDLVDISKMLKGRTLQMGLYHLMTGQPVQVLHVNPRYPPKDGRPSADTFEGFEDGKQRRGFLETLSVLWSLVRRGVFPIAPNRHCDWCDYEPACRRTHPPTLEREAKARDSRDFTDLAQKKKTQATHLAELAGRTDDAAEEA